MTFQNVCMFINIGKYIQCKKNNDFKKLRFDSAIISIFRPPNENMFRFVTENTNSILTNNEDEIKNYMAIYFICLFRNGGM